MLYCYEICVWLSNMKYIWHCAVTGLSGKLWFHFETKNSVSSWLNLAKDVASSRWNVSASTFIHGPPLLLERTKVWFFITQPSREVCKSNEAWRIGKPICCAGRRILKPVETKPKQAPLTSRSLCHTTLHLWAVSWLPQNRWIYIYIYIYRNTYAYIYIYINYILYEQLCAGEGAAVRKNLANLDHDWLKLDISPRLLVKYGCGPPPFSWIKLDISHLGF